MAAARVLTVLGILALAGPALAGGGPESTIVVANAESPDSLEVANAYVRDRDVPARNLVVLTGVPKEPVIPIGDFRTRVWAPIRAWLDANDPKGRIDLIAYSAGFPYGVDFAPDTTAKGITLAQGISPTAALAALTYFARRVEKEDPECFVLGANGYFRKPDGGACQPTHAFHSRFAWLGDDEPRRSLVQELKDRYWLCAALAYTGPNGTTAAEAVAYLKTAAACDGTEPKGTFYFLANDDVRANTREPFFTGAADALKDLGRKVEVLTKGEANQDGVLPLGKEDVVGVVAGIADFDWSRSKSRLLPGAIAEHLTSFGAHFGTSGQTKCVKFLLAGAAGTGGAVAEPYAIPHKFPSPWMHVHYARGCSMAEAMYQSLWGPYQYMVMGDPLARPFAAFAKVDVVSPAADAPAKGTVDARAKVVAAEGHPIGTIELWVDGAFVAEGKADEAISWDTTTAEDGAHEVRLIAVEDSPVATRSYGAARVVVANGTAKATLKGPTKPVALGRDVVLTGAAAGAKSVEVRAGTRVLATVAKGGSFKVEVPADALGVGIVALHAAATLPDGKVVLSAPVDVVVDRPAPRRGGR